jgi:U3 small nucleolar RNA-associated protein 10
LELQAVEEAILTIGIAIDHSKSVSLQRIDNLLLQFMLLALDIRGNKEFNVGDAVVLETQALNIIVRLVHKLNDTIFKPMFLRVFEWATEDMKGTDTDLTNKRSIAFWKLLAVLTDGLKVRAIYLVGRSKLTFSRRSRFLRAIMDTSLTTRWRS